MFLDKISSCYYPTRILLLDDNNKFLEAVSTYLGSDQQLVQFADPLAATYSATKQ